MTEPLPAPIDSEAAVPTAAATIPAPARGRLWRQPALWLAIAAIGLAGWQWLATQERLRGTQAEVAKRLADADALARETQVIARQAQDSSLAVQARLLALEGRLGEFQSQQSALEGLYQELARGRDEWTLAEVEQLITLAAQQLQLAGNVQAAVLALTNADARLARANRPQFLPLRKALGRDQERLRALPFVDVPGLSVKLEGVVMSADTLPLAFEERPRGEARAKAPPVEAWWTRLGAEVWQEVKSLVRIERFDRPEPALLSPTQAFFLRENLKLRLLNARLALLARDQGTFRGETRQALAWLERHFDGRDKSVQAALATLKPLATAEVVVDLPNLNESLSLLRTVRLGKERAP